jgi:hypothetical protein
VVHQGNETLLLDDPQGSVEVLSDPETVPRTLRNEGVDSIILIVSEATRLYKFIEYIEPAIGNTSYWVWESGIVPDGPGAYADNERVPDIQEVMTAVSSALA